MAAVSNRYIAPEVPLLNLDRAVKLCEEKQNTAGEQQAAVGNKLFFQRNVVIF
jgi:hypothetical protein